MHQAVPTAARGAPEHDVEEGPPLEGGPVLDQKYDEHCLPSTRKQCMPSRKAGAVENAPEHDVEEGPPLEGGPVLDRPVAGLDAGGRQDAQHDEGDDDEHGHHHGRAAHDGQAPVVQVGQHQGGQRQQRIPAAQPAVGACDETKVCKINMCKTKIKMWEADK